MNALVLLPICQMLFERTGVIRAHPRSLGLTGDGDHDSDRQRHSEEHSKQASRLDSVSPPWPLTCRGRVIAMMGCGWSCG